jgi:hypothetical protein
MYRGDLAAKNRRIPDQRWPRGSPAQRRSDILINQPGTSEYVFGGILMEAYCFKCRGKQEIRNPQQVTLKNGRPATQGVCPVCGTKVFRIGKS